MDPSTRRLALVGACAAGLAVLALLRPRAPQAPDEYGPPSSAAPSEQPQDGAPAEGETASGEAAPSDSVDSAAEVAGAASAPRRLLRTDTVEVGDVPAPGRTGPARHYERAASASLPSGPGSATTASGARWTAAEGISAAAVETARPNTIGYAPGPGGSSPAGSEPASARGSPHAKNGPRGDSKSQLVSDIRGSGLAMDRATLAKTAGILDQAKLLRTGGIDFSSPKALENSIVAAATAQAKADSQTKSAVAGLQASGKPVSEDDKRQAAAGALAANGLPADSQSVDDAVGRLNSNTPVPTPAQIRDVAHDVATHPPEPAAVARIAAEIDKPRPLKPLGNPMKAREVAEKYKKELCDAAAKHGVPPHMIMGLLSVETDFGRDMGNERLTDALQVRANKGIKQAVSDLRALPASVARGDYGGAKASEIRSNAWGAICYPQFLASSVLSLGESASGGRAVNVCDMSDAIASAANYLDRSGYRSSPEKAIFAYNHSQKYVNDVKDRGAAMQKEAPVKCN